MTESTITQFDRRIAALDTSLFDRIPTESSPNDRRSLLACQLAARTLTQEFAYLEIGSYRGGTIQPYLLDPRCVRIFSIDSRISKMPDNRGLTFKYPHNSTLRMMDHLGEVDSQAIGKVTCLEGDARSLDPGMIEGPVQLCLIDGEHTDAAVLADFEFCLRVLDSNGVLVFHDAQVIYYALSKVIERLRTDQRFFHAYNLPDCLLVVELGDFPLHENVHIRALLLDNYVGYLTSLQANDHYRRIANLPFVRMLRAAKGRIQRNDVSR